MFLSDTHLPQLLPTEAYFDPEHAHREQHQLFEPGWHCVATTLELPDEGSFLTTTLLDRPLILWRREGQIRAFLNVCAHRFSMLTDDPLGRCDRLKCRYHGWEYDHHGDTKRIPDAKNFKPLRRGELGLTALPCDTAGCLVFVAVHPNPISLGEYLGPGRELCDAWFDDRCRMVLATDRDNHSNWKVSIENSLEGYHLTEVHASTFGNFPNAEQCEHVLHDERRSELRVRRDSSDRLTRMGRRLAAIAGIEPQIEYQQFHCYPNFVVARFGPFRWMQATYPRGGSDSYDVWRFLSTGVDPTTARGRIVHAGMKAWGKRWFQKVIDEDEAIFPKIQRGLESPRRPGDGLVSIREERVHHFQRYVQTLVDAPEFSITERDGSDMSEVPACS